jgi:hypothetical protein
MIWENYDIVAFFNDERRRPRVSVKNKLTGKESIISYYRYIYETHYKIEIDPRMEFHHLDFNKNNNDASNLIPLMPSQHRRIHRCFDNIRNTFYYVNQGENISLKVLRPFVSKYKVLTQFEQDGCLFLWVRDHKKNEFAVKKSDILKEIGWL